MTASPRTELLLLHALPFDGSMWAAQQGLLPGSTLSPTLYSLGTGVEVWAAAAAKMVKGNRVIVVGCSVGGSCAIELALAAPNRVAALVLIGSKAAHRPDPALHNKALNILRTSGMEMAWAEFWAPLFSPSAAREIVSTAKRTALRQSPDDFARGVTAFHTRPSRDRFLATYSGPCIVVTGADEIAVKVSAAQADQAPNGRLHVIPECGHYVPLEKPEVLNSILQDVIALV